MARRNREMCVKIARDVLAQLRLGRFTATPGTYVKIDLGDQFFSQVCDQSFQKVFQDNKEARCDVCALGAAFVSLVNIENKASVGDVADYETMWPRLEKYFGSQNISMMEAAFECWGSDGGDDSDEPQVLAASLWGEQFDDDTVRLQNIMRNVIRNNGDFKPPQKYMAKARRLEKEYADTGW